MGLDGVELILQLEETFGVSIPDEEAQSMTTVGNAFVVVASRVNAERREVCLSAAAFFRLRRALCELLGADRTDVRPSTPIRSLIPRNCRRRVWPLLQQHSGLRLPSLARPKWLGTGLLFAATTCLSMSALANRLPIGQIGFALQLFFATALAVVGLLFVVTLPTATNLPRAGATVGETAQLLALNNATVLMSYSRGWSHGELWETLQTVVADTLSVERSKITPNTRFSDLGIS